ncbi:phenoloxidase-activating factor 1-like isoform X1 [Photinus pyralis]|uniref:phenoloxidase-activating factor 1-like isoform X1 n=2 Tax=Photinus pyralis TaxID=7054 RepID=UPI001266EBF9|nr:phenoloxidase-activating factor 1-like isoform X1 [Photinus pyralis]
MNFDVLVYIERIIIAIMTSKLVFLYTLLGLAAHALPENNLLETRRYCGFQHSDDYTRNDDSTSLDEFPWIGQLLYNKDNTLKCVGSLINRRYVLTSAHCLLPPTLQFNITGVRFGDYDVTTNQDCVNYTNFGEECSDPTQQFGIEELIPHPEYNSRTFQKDIGLIRLSRAVTYTDYIRPICLPKSKGSEPQSGTQFVSSGWGDERHSIKHTTIKKRILTKLISLEECHRSLGNSASFITHDHLCVIDERGSFTGATDSGAPLMRSVKNQWEQVGVHSFRKLGGSDSPVIYGKVTSYLDWITENVRA